MAWLFSVGDDHRTPSELAYRSGIWIAVGDGGFLAVDAGYIYCQIIHRNGTGSGIYLAICHTLGATGLYAIENNRLDGLG